MGGRVRGSMTTTPGQVKKASDRWRNICMWSHLR
ncbi:hypothetical protein Godav_028976 [Gossypium davidsonii]|uniref:Uncharacterized protein n=1 Tax=Gossypium davidsonii TaxID=34287 RepID=A0A7J8TAB4_GOSDV|nr:hypothetical protein [Gossypium davidsonii]